MNQTGQLLDVWVDAVRFERNYRYDEDDADKLSYSVDVEIDATVAPTREGGIVTMTAAVEWMSDEEVEPPFELAMTLNGLMEWQELETDVEDIKRWMKFNGEHLLWPYLRTYFQTVSGWSDLPSITLYTIGVPRPRVAKPEAHLETGGM